MYFYLLSSRFVKIWMASNSPVNFTVVWVMKRSLYVGLTMSCSLCVASDLICYNARSNLLLGENREFYILLQGRLKIEMFATRSLSN